MFNRLLGKEPKQEAAPPDSAAAPPVAEGDVAELGQEKAQNVNVADVLLDDDESQEQDRFVEEERTRFLADQIARALEERRKPDPLEQSRRELVKVEEVIKSIRNNNVPDEYITADGKLNYLKYEDLKERRDELRRYIENEERSRQQMLREEHDSYQLAKERARQIFRERIARVPESLRKELAREYEAGFNQIRDWVPLTRNRATLERALQVLFDGALGKAVLNQPEDAFGRPLSGLENEQAQKRPQKQLDKESMVPAARAFLKAARHPDFLNEEL